MKYILLTLIISGIAWRTALLVYDKSRKKTPQKPPVPQNELVAQVMCTGTDTLSPKKYRYDGISDCRAASELFGGPKDCEKGCVGLGSCVQVCPRDAIHIIGGIAAVDRAKCDGCGECVKACPKSVITLIPRKAVYWVGCSYCGELPNTRTSCNAGCDGCGECIKACPASAIKLNNGKACINYDICVACGACKSACPRKSIWQAV